MRERLALRLGLALAVLGSTPGCVGVGQGAMDWASLFSTTTTSTANYSNPSLSSVTPGTLNAGIYYGATGTPTIMGVGAANTSVITLYSDSSCSTSIGSGTLALFQGAGIAATVPMNATTSIYAQALFTDSTLSACTSLLSYYADNTVPSVVITTPAASPASIKDLTAITTISGTCTESTLISISYGAGLTGVSSTACSGSAFSFTVSQSTTSTSVYNVTVTLSQSDYAGNSFSASQDFAVSSCAINTSPTVAAVYPTNGANWNDYVQTSGVITAANWTNQFLQTDTACSMAAAQEPYRCLHGGELRKVALPNQGSCTGISVSDSLGVFDWKCVVLGGVPTAVSQSLAPSKGLRDLVNTASWKNNSVTVTRSGCPSAIATTTATAWWVNTVAALPSSVGGVQTLSTAGTIYTQTGNTTSAGYFINASKVGIVTLGTSALSPAAALSGSGPCAAGGVAGSTERTILCAGSKNHLWLEAAITDNTAFSLDELIYLSTVKHSRVHLTTLVSNSAGGAPNNFLYLEAPGSWGNRITDSAMSGATSSAIMLDQALKNELRGLHISHSGMGTMLWGASNNVIANSSLTSNSEGIALEINTTAGTSSADNSLASIVSAFNSSYGLRLDASASASLTVTGTDAVGVTAVNNQAANFHMLGNSSTNRTVQRTTLQNATLSGSTVDGLQGQFVLNARLSDLAMTDTPNKAVRLTSSSTIDIINDLRTEAAATCDLTSSVSVGLSAGCLHGPSSGVTTSPITIPSTTTSFVGWLFTDEPLNSSDANGSAAATSITDWISFSNPIFQAWGPGGSNPFHSATNANSCTIGTCRIGDFRLLTTDTLLRDPASIGAFISGAACPSLVDASNAANVMSDFRTTPKTFLRNAIEIVGDGLGNEDGMCETDERCIYAPNIGAYQGNTPASSPCTYSGGNGVTGVEMFGYLNNGE